MSNTDLIGNIPRVLHVVGAMNLGGAETMLMNLYRSVDRRIVQFDFLAYTEFPAVYDAEITAMGGRIFRMQPPAQLGYRASVSQLTKLLRRQGPFRAVHSHVLHASALAMRAASKAQVPIRVAHSHNTHSDSKPPGISRRAYLALSRHLLIREATVLVACGEDAGCYLFGRQWPKRGIVVRNSIDLDAFFPGSGANREKRPANLGHGIGDRTLILGSVARMERVKNHAFLIEMARYLADAEFDFRLLLVGDGSLRGEIQSQIQELKLTDKVIVLGQRRDVPEILRTFDINLLPSHFEGLPVVLVEAQAAGTTSIVSTNVTREVDLKLGLVRFEPIDSAQVWAKIIMAEGPVPSPPSENIRRAIVDGGYHVKDAVGQLTRMYGLTH